MSTEIALRPRAHHPGGSASLEFADADGHRTIERRASVEAALARSRIVRRFVREPLFALPALGALGHFLVWLF
jgi:hypothetical protein